MQRDRFYKRMLYSVQVSHKEKSFERDWEAWKSFTDLHLEGWRQVPQEEESTPGRWNSTCKGMEGWKSMAASVWSECRDRVAGNRAIC